ncbi:hypothetical protein GQF56_11430 [Rhodobacter sphaeroides]|uniref:Aminoglycoside phosphotransferase domain-containing protein n=1 Tax=Cereibacter sphaeroides (strain ATCC 17023 / DSM 158 / JCM 6121 / CCUG 31486 / LMG 2827 / NBRC 12203 / NCIMB 8253 / ATH 2.4.1.) TaxID=272943 RepID=Q3J4H7_CERS4|nr:hypothetical protein [Cereibacter sphaeroides]ABA78307.1 hypothetical protein RSP_2154 [Cereibacter sphaeroides 2.4.1]AMJ46661.1 hypothetical protein APX01_03700 [Cereibacter sphaeroides]ANS33374.1 hypothetical protein A3858_03715 [Cereibacter sphaeroides]ATN62417.1 hypothetical protein A3857_03710 [Cereibacter sphaeroides]AXC60524.1 hypothetical protein DQL45_03850 [Cereibacter sphaeroides 2.4.1]
MTSRTAQIRATARSDRRAAEDMLARLIHDLFGIAVRDLAINLDRYSLNSLNGFFESDEGPCFFKFHQEEGEEAMRGEYYRADLLAEAGLPVDRPIRVSSLPGEQILIYRRRSDPRFSDLLRGLDLAPDAAAMARALEAEGVLNDRLLAVAQESLHPITPTQSQAEPIHRLFHERLVEPGSRAYPGGRLSGFYVGKDFELPGLTLPWEVLAHAPLVIDGMAYDRTLAQLFDEAHARLAPERLADAGGITAHGDAHNANVWYERGAEADRLVFFDPAFAGSHVPSLLAEVKSTFHNILAHPLWLYDPEEVAPRWQVTARLQEGALHLDSDWQPGALREGLLAVKARRFWRPWLAHLAAKGLLPPDWEEVVRLALFLCPTLVMSLRAGPGAGPHTPASSALGLMAAVRAGARPVAGEDRLVRFFDAVRPRGLPVQG